MHAYFLKAAVPLTKRYEWVDGTLVKHAYPRVTDFTSIEASFATLSEFADLLKEHAALGHCLLKGTLSRALNNESRAGSTDPNTPTRMLCLDLDGLHRLDTVKKFMTAIGLGDVEYVVQYSSSMGVEPDKGLSTHIFVLLDQPAPPALLKQWLIQLNLTIPELRAELSLTKTNMALRWGLDVTTCQNDKLIYIAPPKLGRGVKDTFKGERIQYIKGKKKHATLPKPISATAANRKATDDEINRLRLDAGLDAVKKFKYKQAGPVEYLVGPDQATVTEYKVERGFVYLNLNGGDSWAYYHPENNPEYIFNFKGEPTYKTSELLPEYWAQLQANTERGVPDSEGRVYLAFRDFKTAEYHNAIWDTQADTLQLARAKSETQLRHFMQQYGKPMGEFVPDWTIQFDPHAGFLVDTAQQVVNTYEPSEYMRRTPVRHKVPVTIEKVIRSVCGNDEAVYEHFLNWLACIFQYLDRTDTAWIFHGTQGTGKGVMIHRILAPLLGQRYVVSKRQEELESGFNGYMENCFVLFVDEVQMSSSAKAAQIDQNLKNYIVEPTISIRKMFTPHYEARNYMNVILASNKPDPVVIPPDDRRYNVGAYQHQRLLLTTEDILAIEMELEPFYGYLMTRTADRDLARTVLDNEHRQQIINISRTSADVVSDAVLQGDLSFFFDQLPDSELLLDQFTEFKVAQYEGLLKDIILAPKLPDRLTRDQLRVLFDYCVGDMPKTPNKFTSFLKHHRIYLATIKHEGRTAQGIHVHWKSSERWLNEKREELKPQPKPAAGRPLKRVK